MKERINHKYKLRKINHLPRLCSTQKLNFFFVFSLDKKVRVHNLKENSSLIHKRTSDTISAPVSHSFINEIPSFIPHSTLHTLRAPEAKFNFCRHHESERVQSWHQYTQVCSYALASLIVAGKTCPKFEPAAPPPSYSGGRRAYVYILPLSDRWAALGSQRTNNRGSRVSRRGRYA